MLLDEFNLICYMSMYANINGAITLMNENRSMYNIRKVFINCNEINVIIKLIMVLLKINIFMYHS